MLQHINTHGTSHIFTLCIILSNTSRPLTITLCDYNIVHNKFSLLSEKPPASLRLGACALAIQDLADSPPSKRMRWVKRNRSRSLSMAIPKKGGTVATDLKEIPPHALESPEVCWSLFDLPKASAGRNGFPPSSSGSSQTTWRRGVQRGGGHTEAMERGKKRKPLEIYETLSMIANDSEYVLVRLDRKVRAKQ